MAMNALSLYVTTCRMIFQADIEDSGAWSDINRLVLYLRQALTCCVCGQLLTIPMSSTVSSCQHHVCKGCVGGKMRLKPSCSWCKDHSKFVENTQLRILLQCYKRLCDFIISSDIPNKWGNINVGPATGASMASSSNNNLISGPTNFSDLVEEGANLSDKYSFSEPLPLRGFNRTGTGTTPSSTVGNQSLTLKAVDKNLGRTVNSIINGDSNSSSDPSLSSLSLSNGGTIRRVSTEGTIVQAVTGATTIIRVAAAGENTSTGSSLLNGTATVITTTTSTATSTQPKMKPKRRGCRCGLATPNPGKLTCCGQRCPCYVDGKGCFECKCRGCRNPHKANSGPGSSGVQPAVKQMATLLASNTASLMAPSLLLSTASPINLGSSLLTTGSPRNCSNATINFISSTSSSPTAAICVVGAGPGGSEPLTLPFPKLEEMEDPEEGVTVTTATVGIGTEDEGETILIEEDEEEEEELQSCQETIDLASGTHQVIIPVVGDDVDIHG